MKKRRWGGGFAPGGTDFYVPCWVLLHAHHATGRNPEQELIAGKYPRRTEPKVKYKKYPLQQRAIWAGVAAQEILKKEAGIAKPFGMPETR